MMLMMNLCLIETKEMTHCEEVENINVYLWEMFRQGAARTATKSTSPFRRSRCTCGRTVKAVNALTAVNPSPGLGYCKVTFGRIQVKDSSDER